MNKPPLYDIVDKLYHGVMDKMPQALQDRGEAMAFLLGAGGIYGVVKGLQWTSRNAMNKLIPNFDEKWLPALKRYVLLEWLLLQLYMLWQTQTAQEIL